MRNDLLGLLRRTASRGAGTLWVPRAVGATAGLPSSAGVVCGLVLLVMVGSLTVARADEKYPGTPEGARALLKEFVKPGADQAALSKLLQPTADDYRRVFTADFAPKAEAYYTPLWNSGGAVIAPEARQTEIQLESATVKELKAKAAQMARPSGPILPVIDKFTDDLVLFEFRFLEPGKTLGLHFGGLVFVNDHWRLFPKPARILQRPQS